MKTPCWFSTQDLREPMLPPIGTRKNQLFWPKSEWHFKIELYSSVFKCKMWIYLYCFYSDYFNHVSVCEIASGNCKGPVSEEESFPSGRSPLLPHGFSRCVRVRFQYSHGGHHKGRQFHQPEEEEKMPSLLMCCVLLFLAVVAAKVTSCYFIRPITLA